MTWRMTVPDRPDLHVDVYRLGSPALPHRMHVNTYTEDAPDLSCDCGWATFDAPPDLYLDDLALIAAEHYRTADQPGLIPAVTTT